jgi:hypothetical protein
MFKKLISNLPFNPSLLGQVAFYTKRMKQEESLRRLGFGFVALAMVIQMFAVIAPPQKSLAYSSDYIAPNGFSNKTQVLAAWDNNTLGIRDIYARFGVTRDEIVNLSQPVSIRSTADDLWTTGRSSLSAVSKSGSIKQQYKNTEFSVQAGNTTIYVRDLKAWDIVNSYNDYDVFEGVKPDGSKFWIMMDCGNYTQVHAPLPPAPTPAPTPAPAPAPEPAPAPTPLSPPALELRKTIDGGARALKPGDTFSFRFEYRNSVPNSTPAVGVSINDTMDLDSYDIVSSTGNFLFPHNDHNATLVLGSVPYTADFQTAAVLTVKLKANLVNGATTCNAANITSANTTVVYAGGSPGTCITVINPCPLDSSLSATDTRCSQPALVCTLTNSAVNRTTKESTFTTTVTSSNPALTTITSYAYDFGDGANKTNTSAAYTDTAKHIYKDGTYSATVNVNYKSGNGAAQTAKNVTCAAKVETKPDQPLSQSKSAKNITQALTPEKTATTKANAGDVIEYSLTMHNSYDYDRTNVNISDSIQDLLDYTDLDQAFLTSQGGVFDTKTNIVSWPAFVVPANSSVTKLFRVTVKSPVPSTNQPSAMTTSFDCVISNKFGNQVDIPINCPPAKTAEYITTKLPNTGPGTSLAIGFVATVIIGYFFARSRLIARELDIIRADYATTGGF